MGKDNTYSELELREAIACAFEYGRSEVLASQEGRLSSPKTKSILNNTDGKSFERSFKETLRATPNQIQLLKSRK